MPVFAAIEGGGTGWKAALVDHSLSQILDQADFETTTPEETLGSIRAWLSSRSYDSIGIASFGPIDARKGSPRYGYITSTPKPGWKNTDVLGLLGVRDGPVPYIFDTDVNAPAMAEYVYRKDEGFSSCAYVTVGTGVGVGLVVHGQTVKGLMHPEGGHIPVARHPKDSLPCSCSFHSICLEGLCNNVSIAQRLGIDRRALASVSDDDEVWEIAGFYLAQLCASLVLLVSTERIFLGGGLTKRKKLVDEVRRQTLQLLNGYIDHEAVATEEGIARFITEPSWY
jgi:fructokinase